MLERQNTSLSLTSRACRDTIDPMDHTLYQRYLNEYVHLAMRESDGTNRGIAERLSEIQVRNYLVVHGEEKRRALKDARQAFDEHRHWPTDIVLSQLGVERA
jgi:hypothetical protein